MDRLETVYFPFTTILKKYFGTFPGCNVTLLYAAVSMEKIAPNPFV